MNVVISGYYGFDNVGDEAILYSMIKAFKEIEPGINITVLSNNPELTKETYNVKAVNRWSVIEVYKVLKSSDGLISGGGSLLQDETKLWSILYYSVIMKLALLAGKPVFIYAQGIGPIHKSISRYFVKNTLKHTEITVRDQGSKKLLETLGLKKRIEIVPDPVLGLNLQGQSSGWWQHQSFKKPSITVSVRDWPSSSDYKGKIAGALDLLACEGYIIIFIPMHGIHDEKASKETAEKMKKKSYIAPYDASIEEKISIIGKSNLLLGMRLHALIFSSITYTPFIALSYDPKIESFADIAGQPVVGHVMKEDWDGPALFQAMKAALQNEAGESINLRKKIEYLQLEASNTARTAIQYINNR